MVSKRTGGSPHARGRARCDDAIAERAAVLDVDARRLLAFVNEARRTRAATR